MSHSDRLAKLKLFLDTIEEKKQVPQGEFAQFLFQEGDGFSYCPFCLDELAKAGKAREEAVPMAYPAVKICMRPPTAETVDVGDTKALHWHWEFTNFCIAHAIEVLVAMKPEDIMPRLENIKDA